MVQLPFSSTHITDLFLQPPLGCNIPRSLRLQPLKICMRAIHLVTFNAYSSKEVKINHSIWMKNTGCSAEPTKGDGAGGEGRRVFSPFSMYLNLKRIIHLP